MWRSRTVFFAAASLLVILLSTKVLLTQAQDRPPDQTFKTVHLVNLKGDQEKALLACLQTLNDGVAKAGFPTVRYRLWKATGQQQGTHSHLWEATWPSGADYEKIHNDPAWLTAMKAPACAGAADPPEEFHEIYNRYVEVGGKR